MSTEQTIPVRPAIVSAGSEQPVHVCIGQDISLSLNEPCGDSGLTKAEAVHAALNGMLHEFCSVSIDGMSMKNRVMVKLLSFATEAGPLDPDHPGWRTIEDIASHPHSVDSNNEPVDFVPAPQPDGLTNAAALARLYLEDLRPDGFYVTIWDGEYNRGGSPGEHFSRVRDGARSWHVMVASKKAPAVLLPAAADELPNGFARELFEWSSELSSEEVALAREFGLPARAGSRGMILNGSPEIMTAVLDMATRSVVDSFHGRDLSLV